MKISTLNIVSYDIFECLYICGMMINFLSYSVNFILTLLLV